MVNISSAAELNLSPPCKKFAFPSLNQHCTSTLKSGPQYWDLEAVTPLFPICYKNECLKEFCHIDFSFPWVDEVLWGFVQHLEKTDPESFIVLILSFS